LLLAVDHHAALKEIQHDIQQFWLPFVVNLIEVYVIVLHYLELVTCLVSGKAALFLELGVSLPRFLIIVVTLLLEEVNFVRATHDEYLVFVQ
jgi:hypothetical protein